METHPRKNFLKVIGSEWSMGILVVLLSVFVAFAAYQSSIFDSKESDANVEGQKLLTDSNGLYVEANQFVIYDYTMYDGWYINQDGNPDLAQYYQDSFSDNLISSLDRPDGPFDEQYYTEMYAEAESMYEEATTRFDEAQAFGDKADRYQLVVLVLAVGLALAAYGSIMDETKLTRGIFAICSILSLGFGVVLYLTI